MTMRVPVTISIVADVPTLSVKGVDFADTVQRAEQANRDAIVATETAEDYATKARQAQLRISAHNDDCARRFFWSKPPNWREYGGGGYHYRGYCKRDDADGLLVPHGEGESVHPSGNYKCAQFENKSVAGLVFYRFANGSEAAGFEDEARGSAYLHSDDSAFQAVFVGKYVQFTLKLGTIGYPDGSVYHGYCDAIATLGHVAPSGFGLWDSGQSLTVAGYFADGVAEGVARVQAAGDSFIGEFTAGRLIKRARSDGQ